MAHAISLKQPWATLVVHGLKAVEVRKWSTLRRGRVLIHAARVSDERAEAWRQVPEHLREAAKLTGGILGKVEVTDCVRYANLEDFLRDQKRHLNEAAWFDAAGLYGFVFAKAKLLPFSPISGWLRFFPVDEKDLRPVSRDAQRSANIR